MRDYSRELWRRWINSGVVGAVVYFLWSYGHTALAVATIVTVLNYRIEEMFDERLPRK